MLHPSLPLSKERETGAGWCLSVCFKAQDGLCWMISDDPLKEKSKVCPKEWNRPGSACLDPQATAQLERKQRGGISGAISQQILSFFTICLGWEAWGEDTVLWGIQGLSANRGTQAAPRCTEAKHPLPRNFGRCFGAAWGHPAPPFLPTELRVGVRLMEDSKESPDSCSSPHSSGTDALQGARNGIFCSDSDVY